MNNLIHNRISVRPCTESRVYMKSSHDSCKKKMRHPNQQASVSGGARYKSELRRLQEITGAEIKELGDKRAINLPFDRCSHYATFNLIIITIRILRGR